MPLDSRFRVSRILTADDQRDVLEALRILLKGEGRSRQGEINRTAFLALEVLAISS